MGIFLLYTLVFWFGSICFTKVMRYSIQDGQILDKIFNWQNNLNKLSQSPKGWKKGLAKIGGDCHMCFGHAMAFLSFIAYAVFMNVSAHLWVTDTIGGSGLSRFVLCGIINFIWYVLFMSIGSVLNFSILIRKKKKP